MRLLLMGWWGKNNQVMSFKIIGIHVLEGCYYEVVKHLQKGVVYQLCNDYTFQIGPDGNVESVKPKGK